MADPIHIEGIDETVWGLHKLAREPKLGADMRPAARVIAGRAAVIAPRGRARDPHRGRLAASFRVRETRQGAEVYTEVPYAGVRMFAHVVRVPGTDVRRGYERHLTPDPFLTRAAEQTALQVQNETQIAIDRALSHLWGTNG